jgi:hypothetical protein
VAAPARELVLPRRDPVALRVAIERLAHLRPVPHRVVRVARRVGPVVLRPLRQTVEGMGQLNWIKEE